MNPPRRVPGPRINGVRLLPSTITIAALCAGLSAVKFTLEGNPGLAIGMIALAAILDSLDGRVARMLDATTKIGAELDSLSDAVSFGVAPALVLYISLLQGYQLGWIIALLFAVSIVLRLARFNTLLDDDTAPAYTKEYFTGVPSPAGALLALAPVAAMAQWGQGWWTSHWLVVLWVLGSAALVVSRIPTLAMKSVSVPRRMAALLLVLVALLVAGVVTYPYVAMLVLLGLYLVHIPFAMHSRAWVAARPETWEFKPAQRRAERKAIRREPNSGASRPTGVRRLRPRRPRRKVRVAGR
ncbi:CDP-alcohol phosphatidyltransferase family protein [Tomitella biformata]|uniref:CDP-alcohol phosphatidyltransferase family protein n=1 Tax=Tomitella biformata TaxID=630403 RepID=UPI0004B3B05C|nr:phosphatidylcholine/phosphatidylserine synthase [Tomitella biformata]